MAGSSTSNVLDYNPIQCKQNLLTLPLEIRLRIIDYLFTNQVIKVEQLHAERQDEDLVWTLRPVPELNSQFLRTCQQIYAEAKDLLYSSNTFDCSVREGMKLLLSTIGPSKFSHIKHLVIDWEQLQEFAWSLAKPSQRAATESLEVVEMATWRMRVLGGSSFLWRDVKSYERQICQAALEICQKHTQLRIVAQRPYHRSAKAMKTVNVPASNTTHRIKWRLITNVAEMLPEETAVLLERELELLKIDNNSKDGRSSTSMLDPI